MKNHIDPEGQQGGESHLSLPKGTSSQRQSTTPLKMPAFFARSKSVLFIGLALLILMSLGTSFLVLRLMRTGPIKKWSYQTEGFTSSSPIIVNNMVYVLSDSLGDAYGTVYALDAPSGREQWSFRLEGFVPLSPIIVNGTVYVVSNGLAAENSTIYALDAVSGRKKWSYQTEGTISSLSPLIVMDSTLYAISQNSIVYALNALSGDKIWAEQPGGYVPFSLRVANGSVYVASEDTAAKGSMLYALDAVSGHKK